MRKINFICAVVALQLVFCAGGALAFSGDDGWTWPIRGPVLTAYRNGDDPYAAGQHRGVDIGAPVGTRVVAASAGTVTFAGVVGSAGLVVSERTADGRFDLSYLHLSSAAVRRGDVVSGGSPVGAVGTSGSSRSVEAPHLHFGVREAGSASAYRDPLDFLPPAPVGDAPREPAPVPVPVAAPAGREPAAAGAGAAPAAPAGAHGPAALPAPAGAHGPAVVPSPARTPGAVSVPGIGAAPVLGPAPGATAPFAPHAPGFSTALAPNGRHLRPAQPLHAPRTVADGDRTGSGTRRAHAASRGPAPHAPPNPRASRHAASRRGHSPHHGVDLGWLAACLGLVAAATALGHPDGTRRAAKRGRATVAGLLRPITRGS